MGQEYAQCFGCARPLRPRGASREEHPGTFSERKRGLCMSCAVHGEGNWKERQSAVEVRIGDPCEDCDRPMRPIGTKSALAPGTVLHYGRGKCKPCYLKVLAGDPGKAREERITSRAHRSLQLPPRPPNLTGEELYLRQWVEDMVTNRRRRGIPSAGQPVETLGEEAA